MAATSPTAPLTISTQPIRNVIAKPAMNGAIKAATPKTSRTTASIVNKGDLAVDGMDGS